MKSSPGLQAVRERAEEVPPPLDYKVSQRHWWDNRNRAVAEYVPALLDLIETLAGALEQADAALNQLAHNRTYWEDFAQGHEAARAALDKYRSFGDGAT